MTTATARPTRRPNFLDGLTRKPGSTPFRNPAPHSPYAIQNRITMEQWGPDPSGKRDRRGRPVQVLKARVDRVGNIACTQGLARLATMLSSDTDGASRFASAMAIGTDSTAAASTQSQLGASTQIIHLSQASMAASNPGNRTLQYNGTFASNGNACSIHEVGLFATNAATNQMIARTVLGASSINRGSADEIRVSYQLIFGTA